MKAQTQVEPVASFKLDGNDSASSLQATNPVFTIGPFGQTNGAMVFPGSGFVGSLTTDFFKNQRQWSWAGWIKPTRAEGAVQEVYSEGNQGESANIGIEAYMVRVGLWNEDYAPTNWNKVFSPAVIQNNVWQHLAVTFDASASDVGICTIFVNGTNVFSGALPMEKATDSFRLSHHDFCFGDNVGAFNGILQLHVQFSGAISDVRIFESVLSPAEIDVMQPIHIIPPRSLSVSVGANPTFALAGGVPKPLVIQWEFNGNPIAGATNATLTLWNITTNQAGDYSVAIASAEGIRSYGPWTLSVDPTFTKITTGSIASDVGDSVGCAWGDYDNDGFLDLVVANSLGLNEFLYRNNGDGTFTKVTTGPVVTSGGNSTAAAWADYDNNGTLDLFVANYDNENSFLFQNAGNGTFLQITNGSVVNTRGISHGCAWADYDNDGNLDLFIANNLGQANYLYHGNGDGTFERVNSGTIASDRLEDASNGVWGDYNGDGKPDLFVSNYSGKNALYRNEGNGQFTRITAGVLVSDGSTLGAAWADYDNDGNLDLVTTSTGEARLYHNNGVGGFTRAILSNPGKNLAGCAWGDYDNDGFLDLLLTDNSGQDNVLYHNNGNGTFTKVTSGSLVNDGGHSWCAAWGDYDNNGFLDLFIGNRGDLAGLSNEPNFLYRNNGNNNHWLKVKLIGTRSNRSAIGAKVKAMAVIGGKEMWQLREVASGGSFGQATLNIHFGLGDASKAEIVRIEWPSGIVQEIKGLSVNQFLTITEPPILQVGTGMTKSGFEMILTSRGGFKYVIESSADLLTWSYLTTVSNVNGSLQVLDSQAKNLPNRFYRAVTTPRTLLLDETSVGTTVVLIVGDFLDVVLDENPSTGFHWDLAISQTNIVQEVGQPVFVSSNPGVAGAPGKETFQFKAMTTGQANLTFNLYPPGPSGTRPPAETVTYKVMVK